MSFLKNTTSFSRFTFRDEVPQEFWGDFVEKLKQFAFKDIDDLPEDRAWGWVCFEDMLDVEWGEFPPQKGAEYITFSFRLDTRRVPPAVIKKHESIALKKEEAQIRALGKTFVSRERKKEIKEQVIYSLKKRFLPIPAEFQVIWNKSTAMIFFASTQSKVLELFEEYFIHSFGFHLELLSPYGLACTMLDEKGLTVLDTLEATDFHKA